MSALHDEFRHEAVFYSDEAEFLSTITSFVEDGIESDEPVLVVLNAPKLDALRSQLGPGAERVELADMGEVGANPARIIPAWGEFLERHAGSGRRLRGVGEPIWAERSADELVECQRHESLLNLAFADSPGFHLVCPYDTSALDQDVLDEARRSHPHLREAGIGRESSEYRGLGAVAAPFAEPLPDPPAQADTCSFDETGLSALRDLVAGRAADAGFDEEMADDLVLAVDEVAANSVIHGGGGGVVRIWREGSALVCEVRDRGSIRQPLAGRERPVAGQDGGYGLWLANQLCDLVQVRTFAAGSAVRLHMRRARRAPRA
ncbi:MAG: sensor histidine kinase [Actinomycetota bacterium]|nr:sensor histidine kinase [Actinomycetota bacterium]